MALIKCKGCDEDISKQAKECPKCGHPNSKARHQSISRVVGSVIFAGLLLWFYVGGGWEQETAKQLKSIHIQVVRDAIDQYKIAQKQGDPTTICVQAGYVSATLLQAKLEEEFIKWKATEKAVCRAAGL